MVLKVWQIEFGEGNETRTSYGKYGDTKSIKMQLKADVMKFTSDMLMEDGLYHAGNVYGFENFKKGASRLGYDVTVSEDGLRIDMHIRRSGENLFWKATEEAV